MVKHEIKIEVLAPENELKRVFSCHHPSKIFGVISDMLKDIWKLTTSSTSEDKIKWDVSSTDVTKFFGQWRARDTKDEHSIVWIVVTALGIQDPKSLMGNVDVRMSAYIQVKLEHKGPLGYAGRILYLRKFYKSQLQQYVREARKKMIELDNRIKELYESEMPEAE